MAFHPNWDVAKKMRGRAWGLWCIDKHNEGEVRLSNLKGPIIKVSSERLRIEEGLHANVEIKGKRISNIHKAFDDILGKSSAVVGNGVTNRQIRNGRKLLSRVSQDMMLNPEHYSVSIQNY